MRRGKPRLIVALLVLFVLAAVPPAPMPELSVIPPNRPLPAALLAAYNRGGRDITIAPGTYNCLTPEEQHRMDRLEQRRDSRQGSHDHFRGRRPPPRVAQPLPQRPHRGSHPAICRHLVHAGAGQGPRRGCQGQVLRLADRCRIPDEYPAGQEHFQRDRPANPPAQGGHRRLRRPGGGIARTGLFRLRHVHGLMAGVAVDDWLVTRAPGGSSIVQLADCKSLHDERTSP